VAASVDDEILLAHRFSSVETRMNWLFPSGFRAYIEVDIFHKELQGRLLT
jgi:hypothetical protein